MRLQALRNDPSADQEALQFPSFLLQVGEGRVRSQSSKDPDLIDLPPSVTFETSLISLCRSIYCDISQKYSDIAWLTSRVILTTKNNHLASINNYVGNMIPGRYRTYLSADKVENQDAHALRYPVEMLNLLTAGSALPDHKLRPKKGFIIMLLNLDPQSGHVNGTRYIIEKMSNSLLYLRVATGSYQGNELCLPRMPCSPGDDTFPVPGFTRTQFPVRVCFALTTNKAQGQSFGGKLGLDLQNMCLSHGQLYVALSRTTHPKNLSVFTTQPENRTRNVVYPEALR